MSTNEVDYTAYNLVYMAGDCEHPREWLAIELEIRGHERLTSMRNPVLVSIQMREGFGWFWDRRLWYNQANVELPRRLNASTQHTAPGG